MSYVTNFRPAAIVTMVLMTHAVQAQTPADAVPVTTAVAVRQDVPVFATGVGTVQAYRTVAVRARVDGALTKIGFTEGQLVHPGDLLAEIDPRPYQAALALAQAKRAGDAAALANAKLDLTRDTDLARTNVASRQQLDTQRALVDQDQAALLGDEASVNAAALNLAYCTITSPIEGVAGLRQLDEGNLVQAAAAQTIVTITQIHPITLLFPLPQDQLAQVQAALRAPSPALVIAQNSQDGTELGRGQLMTINNSVDAQSGTIMLKALFNNENDRLWPGQFVAARVRLSVDKAVVTVPPSAIQHGPDGLYVYVVRPDQTVTRRDVSEGYADDHVAEILSGVQPGDLLVVEGQIRLQEGTLVAARPAAKS